MPFRIIHASDWHLVRVSHGVEREYDDRHVLARLLDVLEAGAADGGIHR